ncbi:hypothetical protein BT63DRAFT_460913 [Microthyrium microscopicum]|uniref:Uncharacterized protein n=1 Tax=Microthyrium microscopicum TaxID=703497 RepID=A0A6A6TUP0_9PEZI|nr:hypothetical protein BT63DRAFT_460913 [Microthyrium microscopicum]
MVKSSMADAHWRVRTQWGLRILVPIAVVCILFLVFIITCLMFLPLLQSGNMSEMIQSIYIPLLAVEVIHLPLHIWTFKNGWTYSPLALLLATCMLLGWSVGGACFMLETTYLRDYTHNRSLLDILGISICSVSLLQTLLYFAYMVFAATAVYRYRNFNKAMDIEPQKSVDEGLEFEGPRTTHDMNHKTDGTMLDSSDLEAQELNRSWERKNELDAASIRKTELDATQQKQIELDARRSIAELEAKSEKTG